MTVSTKNWLRDPQAVEPTVFVIDYLGHGLLGELSAK